MIVKISNWPGSVKAGKNAVATGLIPVWLSERHNDGAKQPFDALALS
jgi:hypothetical protein